MIDSEELTYIIEGCKNNNPICQSKLYEKYRKTVLTTSYRYVKNKQIAEDITQDVFIKILNKIDTYKTNNNFDSWIKRVTTNKALDHLRKHKYEKYIGDVSNINLSDEYVYDEDEYRIILINNLLEKLSDSYRSVFELFYIDELPHKEIAKRLSINVGTSKSNLFKARNRIRKLMSI